MAKVCVPIIKLRYNKKDAFDLELASILDEEGIYVEELFTYTMRVSVPDAIKRESLRHKIQQRLPPNEANRALGILEKNDWDVSFFVDTW